MTSSLICSHCQRNIPLSRHYSGVINRNHCPHCLWSVHLDNQAGDRTASCHGQMEPIALSFKLPKKNKYGPEKKGEILLVHLCQICHQIRLNRIAADDNTDKILEILSLSQNLSPEIQSLLSEKHLSIATESDKPEIQKQLFGQ